MAQWIKFKDLPIGSKFRFSGEIEFPYSGIAIGPWIKTGARTYQHASGSYGPKGENITFKVGSINAQTMPENPGKGKAFTFHGSAISKLSAERLKAKVPGSFIEKKGGRYYILKPKKIATATFYEPRTAISNARSKVPRGAVKIYGRCLRIEAVKLRAHTYDGKPTPGGQKYFHDFTTKHAMIYGLPDGSLLIKA